MEPWQNFYLQKMGTDSSGVSYPLLESVSSWGVWCKSIPFKMGDKVKEPAKRAWNDEDGDDEYIPSSGLLMESYTMKIEFGCKTTDAVSDVREKVSSFLRYLRTSGSLKMYSSHTRIGRQGVRLSQISDKAWKSGTAGKKRDEFLIFEVEFKVNDPVTSIELKGGQLVSSQDE